MNNISFVVTPDKWARIQQASNFSELNVGEFAKDWVMAAVRACEDDYIMHDGEVIGDTLEVQGLAREAMRELKIRRSPIHQFACVTKQNRQDMNNLDLRFE